MLTRPCLAAALLFSLASCACGAPGTPAPSAPPPPAAPITPTFEVHEWGLVRGTLSDHVMISGPHAPEPVVVVTKPVLYFHRDAARDGESALVVDVDVEIHDGHVVERWPGPASTGATTSWHGVAVQDGSCHGSHYPTLAEEPCSLLTDGCEAATLASVETTDSDCLYWPRPPDDDGPTEAWNHLFYRGERMTAPDLALRLSPQADGTLRVTSTGMDPIPGRFIRVRRVNGVAAGVSDAAEVVSPPAPGQSISVAAPTGTLASAAEALAESLRAAGLTDDEVASFRRSWDEALFGPVAVATRAPQVTATITTTPPVTAPQPAVTTSVLYVLPISSADALATVRITPAPTALRRAIVVWLDEASAP